MSTTLFPKEWWKLPQDEYLEAKASMKALAQKDCDVGTKEVRKFVPWLGGLKVVVLGALSKAHWSFRG